MKLKIFNFFAICILLFSCGPKTITSCNYEEIAEKALDDEARNIHKEYNAKIHYMGAHILNQSDAIKLLELEEYHSNLKDYKLQRQLIEKGYPVIEVFAVFNGYSKHSYGGNTIGTYYQNEGRMVKTIYTYWKDYDKCPCDKNNKNTNSGFRWEYDYSTFFGLTPLFRNLYHSAETYAEYNDKYALKDIRELYDDYENEMVFEFATNEDSKWFNTEGSEWKKLKDSKFIELVSLKENSNYNTHIRDWSKLPL